MRKRSSQGRRADDKKASDWRPVRVSRRSATEPESKPEMQWTERKEKQKPKSQRRSGGRAETDKHTEARKGRET